MGSYEQVKIAPLPVDPLRLQNLRLESDKRRVSHLLACWGISLLLPRYPVTRPALAAPHEQSKAEPEHQSVEPKITSKSRKDRRHRRQSSRKRASAKRR